MIFAWTRDLATGDDEIDSHHQEIFRRFQRVMASVEQGRGARELATLLAFLDDYVVVHFAAEEKRLQEEGSPDYARHRGEHELFRHRLQELKIRHLSGMADVDLEIYCILGNWLRNHIRKSDRALAAGSPGRTPA